MTPKLVGVVKAAVYLGLSWGALTSLVWLGQWSPYLIVLETARMVGLALAAIVMMLAGVGAIATVFSLFVSPGREHAPRPYVPVA